jgi:hypothetical protein
MWFELCDVQEIWNWPLIACDKTMGRPAILFQDRMLSATATQAMLTHSIPYSPRTPGVAVWWSGVSALLISSASSLPLFIVMSVAYSRLPDTMSSYAFQYYEILFACGLSIAAYCSIPVARWITRQCPIRLTAQSAKLNGNPVFTLFAFWAAGVYVLCHFPRPSFVAEAIAPFYQTRFSNLDLMRSLILLAPPGVFFISPLIIYIAWYRKATKLSDQSFILFLRKFSSRSDYSILSGLLTGCPDSATLAILNPKPQVGVGEDGSWDPIAIGFEGCKLLHPLRSMPMHFAANNKEWEDAVFTLMQKAMCVVIDVSESTPSVVREETLITSLDLWQRTVVLKDRKCQNGSGESAEAFNDITSNELEYDLSWTRALPRAVLGMLLAMLAFLLVSGLTLADPVEGPKVMRDVLLIAVGFLSYTGSAATLVGYFWHIVLLYTFVLIGAYSLKRMFGHPSLSFRSAGALRRRLREILAGGAMHERV